MRNLKELFRLGASVAFGLFFFIYYIRIMSADNPSDAVDIFAHTIVVFMFVLVPTSPAGAIISIGAGFAGAAITVQSAKPALIVMAAGFGYTSTNIIINWFTAPV